MPPAAVTGMLQPGQMCEAWRRTAQVMILTLDKEKGRVSLSTKKLEPTPGDMVRDPNLVFSRADEMAAAFRWDLCQPLLLPLSA